MGEGSRVGVVTVTFNSASVIADFMDSMLKQTHADFLLYVVDNASADETLKLVHQYSDARIMVIPNEDNVGVAEGNNIGIRAARRDGCGSVLLVNNDTVFDSVLLSKLVYGLRQHECDMIVPKILFFDEPKRIWSAGGYFSRLRGLSKHFGEGCWDDGRFDRAQAVSYAPTCCMLIKSRIFDSVGLIDPAYFAYYDDTDFCYRARKAGSRLFYLPSARLLHKVGSLTGGESNFAAHYLARNRAYYLLKSFPLWRALFYLLVFQIWIFVKFSFVRPSPAAVVAAERAFWEGVRLFSSQAEQSIVSAETSRIRGASEGQ
jgi:hypothetical protein